MEVLKVLILSIFCWVMRVNNVDGTHFRGGTISWEPINENGTQIEVRYRFGWRLNFEPHYLCTEDAIKNGTLIEGEGDMIMVKRDDDGDKLFEEIVKEPLDYICTDRFTDGSHGEFHWASGVNSFTLDVDERMGTEFELGYFSCCWIGLLNYQPPRRWKMLTKVDLSPRPDNGRINTSPMTSSLPILRIQRGCDFIVDVPFYDKDGDFVKCRWPRALNNECDLPNCGQAHQMFKIKEGSCMVHIDAEAADVGWYAVALMIEDFVSPLSSKPLSSIPFHFLVRVDPGQRKCNDVINIEPMSSCLAAPPGEIFLYKATAKVMNSDIPIVNFASTTPRGMNKSLITSEGDGVYSVEFSWKPRSKQNGTVQTFCYSPFDSERFSGNEVCVELAIGGVRPSPQSVMSVPGNTQTINLSDNVWQIVFDQEVTLHPDVELLARIVDLTGDIIVFNVTTERVNLDLESSQTLVLTFWEPLSDILYENSAYELQILPGIVNGKQLCMLPSTGASWPFNTCMLPFPDSSRSIPSSSLHEGLSVLDFYWNITFFQPISLMSNVSLMAEIFDHEGNTLYNITTDDVIFTHSESNVIRFLTPQWLYLQEESEYEIRIPAGVVISNCNLTSSESRWKFNTTSDFIGGRRPPPKVLDPKVSVLCFPTFMEIFVERDQFGLETDPALMTLNEGYCYGMDHNSTHIRLGTTYGQCGTKAITNEDDSRVSMVNQLKIPSAAFPDEGPFNPYFPIPPTPHPNLEVRVNCSIPSRRVSFVELNPNISTIIFHSDNIGDFNFSLKMFPNDTYRSRYRVKDFPIDVNEDQRLYFEARSFSPKRFGPYLQSCVAAPTSHPHDNSRFTFIENGCPFSRSLEFHESPYKTRIRFSLLAEELLQQGFFGYIFVHCDIRLCNRGQGECNANCPTVTNHIGPLLKRDIRSLAVSDEFMDTDGPIRIVHDHSNKLDNNGKTQWIQITLTCVTGSLIVICLALVVTVFKLKSVIKTAAKTTSHIGFPFAISFPYSLPKSST